MLLFFGPAFVSLKMYYKEIIQKNKKLDTQILFYKFGYFNS